MWSLKGTWENIGRDIKLLIRKTISILQGIQPTKDFQIHVMRSLFFRNKGAYIIGRIVSDGDPTGFGNSYIKKQKWGIVFRYHCFPARKSRSFIFVFQSLFHG